MDEEEKAFLRGFAAMVAWLIRERGEPTLAIYAMNDNGVDLEQLREAGIEPFDLLPIQEAVKNSNN